MDIIKEFPIRRSKVQKKAFQQAIMAYSSSLGYTSSTERASLGGHNIIIGNPEKARYLVTAHYDTCAKMPIPNLITPCNVWAFLGYQLLATLLTLLPACLAGAVVEMLTDSFLAGYLVWYICFLATFLLMILGPANRSNVNDNSSGVVTVLTLMKHLPQEHKDKVCFVLFDLEELGLIGSRSYRNLHKVATNNQIILNLDCVGDGREILAFPTKKLRKDQEKMALLRKLNCEENERKLSLHEKGFYVYPSDQGCFPYGVGIAAFRRKKWIGLYCGRIHTSRDKVLEEENINILRDRLLAVIADQ